MDYSDVFISCLVSHSDGTHSLQRAIDVMLNYSKSVPLKKQIYLRWPANLHFWMNYLFNKLHLKVRSLKGL